MKAKLNDMKKAIIIYLIGVFLAAMLSFYSVNKLCQQRNRPLTYGDIGFIASTSLLSWVSDFVFGVAIIIDQDFWDKPIKSILNEPRPEIKVSCEL